MEFMWGTIRLWRTFLNEACLVDTGQHTIQADDRYSSPGNFLPPVGVPLAHRPGYPWKIKGYQSHSISTIQRVFLAYLKDSAWMVAITTRIGVGNRILVAYRNLPSHFSGKRCMIQQASLLWQGLYRAIEPFSSIPVRIG